MLDDIKPQPRPAAATAMFWTCAFAAARVTDAFAARGLALWREMLAPARPQCLRPMPPSPSLPSAADDEAYAAADPFPSPEPPAAAAPQAEPAFPSYRSDGGHAAAQVIILRGEPRQQA
jgi:hypothetical protein